MIGYLAALVLWVAAIVTLVVSTAGFLESTTLLVTSAVLSGLAMVAAVSAVVMSRRR
ncbi:MAG: hypothetical protein ACRDGO_02850 [Actinomycetota bacterium]